MHKKVAAYVAALIAVGAAGSLGPQVVPGLGSFAEHRWPLGWIVACLSLALVVYQENRAAGLKDRREQLERIRRQVQVLESENEELQERVRGFRPAPAPAKASGVPALRLSGPSPYSEPGTAVYPLSNPSETYRIDALSVESATPGVTVTAVSHTTIDQAYGGEGYGRMDSTIVDVAFKHGHVGPWRAVISYNATSRHSVEQNLS